MRKKSERKIWKWFNLLTETKKGICVCSKGIIEYIDEHDAYCCPKCNVWTESKCSDPNCEFCADRPDRPYDIDEYRYLETDFSLVDFKGFYVWKYAKKRKGIINYKKKLKWRKGKYSHE